MHSEPELNSPSSSSGKFYPGTEKSLGVFSKGAFAENPEQSITFVLLCVLNTLTSAPVTALITLAQPSNQLSTPLVDLLGTWAPRD